MTVSEDVKAMTFLNYRTYLWSLLFVAGNVLLPQLCHGIPDGGKIFMPLMFFSLIAAARFGLCCGMLTAVLSPLAGWALSGMPAGTMLAAVVLKSLLIVGAVGVWRLRGYSFSLLNTVFLVVGYQLAGFLIEGALFWGYAAAWNDLLLSWPGALVQIAALRAVTRNRKS